MEVKIMPKVEGTYAHNMGQEKATEVVKGAVTKLLDAFEATDIDVTDDGRDNIKFSCKSRGFSIDGKAVIKDNEIDVVVNLPMLAMAFKGLVKAAMDKHIPIHLEKQNG
tara:strand:- start:5119 stop:5445 length:327 start_codon:yes stop_codon:yes gene_type:complete